MWIESLIRRKNGTRVTMSGGAEYDFTQRSANDPRHVDWVENEEHVERFLGIPEGFAIAEDYGDWNDDDDIVGKVAASVAQSTDEGDEDSAKEPPAPPEPGSRAWLDSLTKAELFDAIKAEGLDVPSRRWSKEEVYNYAEAVLGIGAD